MIRQRLFSLLTLLGCLAPGVTPRFFPSHPFHASNEPRAGWVTAPAVEKTESPLLSAPLDPESPSPFQLAEQ